MPRMPWIGLLQKASSSSYITCCVKKKHHEVCAQCDEFPCSKFESWLETGGEYDSFLTHKKAKPNLDFIRTHGLSQFMEEQRKRIGLLEIMLKFFDEGRSRSFCCIAMALLPIADIEASLQKSEQRLKAEAERGGLDDRRLKSRILRESLNESAARRGIDLRLRRREGSR